MTQRMQSCDTTRDLERVVQHFMPEILPEFAGRLYLLDGARGALVETVSWSDPVPAAPEFPAMACWALRRGSAHRAAGTHFDVPCAHLRRDDGAVPDTICLPLAGQQGALGLLYLERPSAVPASDIPDIYLETLVENVSLALDNLRLREALHRLAMADPLTMLANRRQLDEALEHHVAEAEREGAPISCAMIDVDHFKRFNDEFGHDAGDAVLRAVGETLRGAAREGHQVFRYGGEEFLLLMPGADAATAAKRAEDIRARIAVLRVRHGDGALDAITASVGVATAPDQCGRASLVQAADAALLRAKRAGRNRVATAGTRKATLTGS